MVYLKRQTIFYFACSCYILSNNNDSTNFGNRAMLYILIKIRSMSYVA